MKPSSLGICAPEDDFSFMGAYTQQRRLMKGYEDKLQAAEMKKNQNKLTKGGN